MAIKLPPKKDVTTVSGTKIPEGFKEFSKNLETLRDSPAVKAASEASKKMFEGFELAKNRGLTNEESLLSAKLCAKQVIYNTSDASKGFKAPAVALNNPVVDAVMLGTEEIIKVKTELVEFKTDVAKISEENRRSRKRTFWTSVLTSIIIASIPTIIQLLT